MKSEEIEKLILRLVKVNDNITKSVNFGAGAPTKAQLLEQSRVVKKLSNEFGLNYDYLIKEMNR